MRSSLTALPLLALAIVGTTWARPLAAEDVAAQAHQLLLDGKADDALQNLQQAVARQADHAGAWFELARTQFYLMKLDDAQKSIARAIQLDPRRARYHYLAGQLAAYNAVLKYKSEETRDQAPKLMGQWVRELEQTAKLDPQFDEAQVELVNAYLQAPGDQGGSREKAEQVVAGLETRSPVAAAKGRCMLIEDKQKKVELWQAMVERHPEDAAARAELARAYMRNEQTAKAKEQVDEALRIDAKQGALLLDYFRHVALQQQFGPAAEALDQYLQLVPPPPVPLRATATFYRATLAKRQQKNEEAEKLLAAAKEMDPHVWMTFRQPPELLFD